MKKELLATTLATSLSLTGLLSTAPTYAMDNTGTEQINQSLPIPNETRALSRMSVASSSSAYKDQAQAISYLNSIRKKIGLSPVTLHTTVAKAAQSHANYLDYNGIHYGHREAKGKKYFTGDRFLDRIEKQGLSMEYRGGGEAISYLGADHVDNINDLMDSSYHRIILTNPFNAHVGIGQKVRPFVINFITSGEEPEEQLYQKDFVYPYNGMKNSPIGFYGFENPNPLAQFKVKESGYIISFTGFAKNMTFDLKDSQGTIIPFYSDFSGNNIFFYPKIELAYSEKYTATVNYTNSISNKQKTKTWSFTTRKDYNVLQELFSNEAYLKINNKKVPTLVEDYNYSVERMPVIKNGIAYIESKYIFPRLNGTVSYNSKTGKTVVKTKNKDISFKTNSKTVTVNGKSEKLSQAPIKIQGKVFVPISLLKTTYGMKGSYDKKARYVSLTGKIDAPYKYSNKVKTVND